jgi:metallo-beta-lactamase class B
VVIVGSPNVLDSYKLTGNKSYPQIADDFRKQFATLKALPCDVFLGAHGAYFDLKGKYDRLKGGEQAAFIDPFGYRRYLEERERAFDTALKRQQASGK